MKRFITLLILAALLVLLALPVGAQDRVTITWFVGLGTGTDPAQQEAQLAVVDAFNQSQDRINLEIVFVDNTEANTALATLIATGQSPDIIGPVGFAGTHAFRENLLDIQPYVDASGYDLSRFPEAAVEFQRTDEGLMGLPLANFPAFLWYRPALFDEAGLEYPPASYGEPHILDGEEVEWNIDTLTEVAKRLTVDANGFDATEEEFDPENIVQWGLDQVGDYPLREHFTLFGAGSLYETLEDGTYKAVMPDHWRESLYWEYNGIWGDNFIPNDAQQSSDLLASGNPFASGNVAMAQTHLWYTCCIEDSEWDAAALPSYNGQVTARLHADTFRILNTSDNPEEAFEVLTYLVGPASLDLLAVYGGMPAVPEEQPAFFETLNEKYPQGVNWDVVRESLNYPDIPSHEEWLPNNNLAWDRVNQLWNLLETEPGLDVDAEIDRLLADLDVIYNTEPE
jgi:multiple sugar transport system substrate-binding protein